VGADDGLDLAVVGDHAAVDGGGVGELQAGVGVDQHGAVAGAGVGQIVAIEHQGVDRVGVWGGAAAGDAGDDLDGAVVGEIAAGDVADGVGADDGLDLAVVGDHAAVDGGGVGELQAGVGVDQHGAVAGAGVGQIVAIEHQGVDRVGVWGGAAAGDAGDDLDGAVVGEIAAGDVADGVGADDGLDLAVVGDHAAVDGGGVGELQAGVGVDQHGAVAGAGVGQIVAIEHQGVDRVGVWGGAAAGDAGDDLDGAVVGEIAAGDVADGVGADDGLDLAVVGDHAAVDGGGVGELQAGV